MMIGVNGRELGTGKFERTGSTAAQRSAFTLVEMLVVIAIIGVLSGLTLGVIPRVMDGRDKRRTEALIRTLELAIENFHSTYNSYPPCNPSNNIVNTLCYELKGTIIDNSGAYHSPQDTTTAAGMDVGFLNTWFGCSGLINATNSTAGLGGPNSSAAVSLAVPHDFLPELNGTHYGLVPITNLYPVPPFTLPAPPPLPQNILLFNTGIRANPNGNLQAYLRYDNTFTNRHNLRSYDLWVTWTNSTSKPVIVGNF
jgi:prepilin-type N-terminal cleavage/methylation domain-containing protein